eukprot:CAMPEP_0196999272 /NCGR_PEP_ID=MMETSP1380-20130617/4504_1 /TAXON_ID=5936 /ORGANISM="Euplotes crassus, Strain CT5" /LENGTH=155 /DNA_ID=CAMNT_0042416151 /DNA_START=18 /DNA_END=485 /DNA_ORIENTATION=-
MTLNSNYKRQRVSEHSQDSEEMSVSDLNIHFDSTKLDKHHKAFISKTSKNGKFNKFRKIFKIQKGRSSKRKKHILKFYQISILENYFLKDPDWQMATVEIAAAKLGLPVKKVYKWGYDRKHVSRDLGDISPVNTNDYNALVDEIIVLKAKELNLK